MEGSVGRGLTLSRVGPIALAFHSHPPQPVWTEKYWRNTRKLQEKYKRITREKYKIGPITLTYHSYPHQPILTEKYSRNTREIHDWPDFISISLQSTSAYLDREILRNKWEIYEKHKREACLDREIHELQHKPKNWSEVMKSSIYTKVEYYLLPLQFWW